MPAGIIRRSIKHRPSKRKNIMANRPQPTAPISIASATKAGSVVTVVFNQPVALKGVPKYTTDVAGSHADSAVLTSPTTLAVTFDIPIAAGLELRIPYEEPAVRNASGGFVAASTFKLT